MDGMTPAPPVRPMRVVQKGVRYGIEAAGKTMWLPVEMWPAAAAWVRQYEADMAFAERMQKRWEQAQDAAFDAVTGTQNA